MKKDLPFRMARFIKREFRNTIKRLKRLTGVNVEVLSSDKVAWKDKAQQGEYNFHVKDEWRTTEDFTHQTAKLFDHFGFNQHGYIGKTVIDLGAGSKLRTRYFKGATIIAIEPLASRFMQDIEWCDLSDAAQVHSSPAELNIADCNGVADLVVSINVLDHCYGFRSAVKNIRSYLKPDGMAFLSFDKHHFADEMHPLELDEDSCEEIFISEGFSIEKSSKGAGKILTTYGHGPYCLNFWLKTANTEVA